MSPPTSRKADAGCAEVHRPALWTFRSSFKAAMCRVPTPETFGWSRSPPNVWRNNMESFLGCIALFHRSKSMGIGVGGNVGLDARYEDDPRLLLLRNKRRLLYLRRTGLCFPSSHSNSLVRVIPLSLLSLGGDSLVRTSLDSLRPALGHSPCTWVVVRPISSSSSRDLPHGS